MRQVLNLASRDLKCRWRLGNVWIHSIREDKKKLGHNAENYRDRKRLWNLINPRTSNPGFPEYIWSYLLSDCLCVIAIKT